MATREEVTKQFLDREQNKKLAGVKNKAAMELKNLDAPDRLLVVDLMRLRDKFGLQKIMRLLNIISLIEK